ncbi:hypothetical protein [Streptomyces spinoverrucosus]|uniref:hypothetical protein n=1 Tax=Streptomyces spinoverrucosus TaxID=284043 RepID=UPI001E3B8B82|nr:hypothetical protein [Streptomyces spinoverrucosus]
MRPSPPPAKKGKPKTSQRRKKTSLRNKYLFGYDAHLIVTRDAEHEAVLLDDGTPNPEVLPALVLGVALDKPGHRPAYSGLKILNRLRERGYKPGYLAGDRAYNNSDPDEWQLPVRAMGYKPVYDYRADQLGKQAGTHGAILVEGRWYCPSMPDPLINATIDLHADRIDRETWIKLIAARRSYRIMPKENADADGYQRMMCPAEAARPSAPSNLALSGEASTCPSSTPNPARPARSRSAASARSPSAPNPAPSNGRPSTTAARNGRGCTSSSATASRATTATPRTPSPRAPNPRAPAVSAVAAQTILLAFQLAHANRRKIKKWLDTLSLGGERPRRRTHHRRPKKEPRSWTPTGHLAPAA